MPKQTFFCVQVVEERYPAVQNVNAESVVAAMDDLQFQAEREGWHRGQKPRDNEKLHLFVFFQDRWFSRTLFRGQPVFRGEGE